MPQWENVCLHISTIQMLYVVDCVANKNEIQMRKGQEFIDQEPEMQNNCKIKARNSLIRKQKCKINAK